LRNDLPRAFGSGSKARIDAALPPAIKAIESYLAFVEGPLQKLPGGDFRYGRALYDERFGHYLQTELSPDEVLGRAEKRIAEVRGRMGKLAAPLYRGPAKDHLGDGEIIRWVLGDIAREHATPDGLFQEAKEDVARERGFVREHGILTLPATDNLQIAPTPPFM